MTGPDVDTAAAQPSFSAVMTEAEKRVARLGKLRDQAEQVSVTETSRDGGVTATVNSGAVLTDLSITDEASGQPGARIAAQVLDTMRRAQAGIAARMDEVMRTAVDDDPELRDRVLAVYHDRFPEPEPDPARRQAADGEMRFGLPEGD